MQVSRSFLMPMGKPWYERWICAVTRSGFMSRSQGRWGLEHTILAALHVLYFAIVVPKNRILDCHSFETSLLVGSSQTSSYSTKVSMPGTRYQIGSSSGVGSARQWYAKGYQGATTEGWAAVLVLTASADSGMSNLCPLLLCEICEKCSTVLWQKRKIVIF
jgi:hypothetical protein